MNVKEIEQFLRKQNRFFPMDLIQNIEQERMNAIQEKDEEKASLYWKYAVIYYIQRGYVMVYDMLKNRNYEGAWDTLKEMDMQLAVLEQNYPFSKEEEDPYHLAFILSMLQEFEKLFPYEFFICREYVIKEQKCSICGEKVRLRGGCNHVPGKIYMGELCVHEVTDKEYLGMKVTRDPFDKYDLLKPYRSEEVKYSYDMLNALMKNLKSPYDYWEVEVVKEKNPEYARIGRNDRCPCGSGKKFKHCCMNDERKMMFEHYKIKMLNDMDEKVSQPLQIIK